MILRELARTTCIHTVQIDLLYSTIQPESSNPSQLIWLLDWLSDWLLGYLRGFLMIKNIIITMIQILTLQNLERQ